MSNISIFSDNVFEGITACSSHKGILSAMPGESLESLFELKREKKEEGGRV